MLRRSLAALPVLTLTSLAALAACGGGATGAPIAAFNPDGGGAHDAATTTSGQDGGVSPVGSGTGGTGTGTGTGTGGTGTGSGTGGTGAGSGTGTGTGTPAPRNASCVPTSQQSGTAVNTSHGRLDGTLVYVVGVGQDHQCNGDSSHVHLQVQVSGEVYDVAVDIGTAPSDEVGSLEQSMALPGGPWAEGWHGSDSLAYPSLGLHSSSFVTAAPSAMGSQVEAALTATSEISIYCTGYSQGNGCHDVHYKNGSGEDGAIVLNPNSATPQILFFRFQTQSF